MKTILFAFLLSTAAFAAEKTDTIKVSGWHCDNCPKHTETALKSVDGVKSVKSDRKAGHVVVKYDDTKAKRADLEKAIASSGFEPGK